MLAGGEQVMFGKGRSKPLGSFVEPASGPQSGLVEWDYA